MPENAIPAYITSLMRHFEDLRDGTHGGSASREDKEAHFEKAVRLLAPIARQVLTEVNSSLLLDSGRVTETGLRRTADGGLNASWALSWPEQRAAGVQAIVLEAYFGGSFHHPHLRGATVEDWPLNVFNDEDAVAQLSILRAIASSDLHNLVYRADYRIIPAVTAFPRAQLADGTKQRNSSYAGLGNPIRRPYSFRCVTEARESRGMPRGS
jgi:hypothetical protein